MQSNAALEYDYSVAKLFPMDNGYFWYSWNDNRCFKLQHNLHFQI